MNSNKKRFLKNVVQLSSSIFLNKPIGLLRDILRIRYFGVTILGDAFSVAWRIPNTLRRIFGEGNFSAALLPSLIKTKEAKNGEQMLNRVITAILFIMTPCIFFLCGIIAYFSKEIVNILSPGSSERIVLTVPLLTIMVFFTVFMVIAVIMGCALQVHRIFYSGPISQFILNIALCIEFFLAIRYSFSVQFIAWATVWNGLLIVMVHWYLCIKKGIRLLIPNKESFIVVFQSMKKIVPVLISGGITDINFFVDQAIASYLPIGSQSMLDYISGFIRIPTQVVGSSIATVCMTEFSYVVLHNKRRLSFYFLEIGKIIFLVALFCITGIYFFSHELLTHLFLSEKFTSVHVLQGENLLFLLSFIIFFSSINKVITNVFYVHQQIRPLTLCSIGATIMNFFLNIIMMRWWGLSGIVTATVFVEIVRTFVYLMIIHKKNIMKIPIKRVKFFMNRSILLYVIILGIGTVFYLFFKSILFCVGLWKIIHNTLLFWPFLFLIFIPLLPISLHLKKKFSIKLYYFDK